MEAAQSTFISSTFWTERIGPTAALKTLEVMDRLGSWKIITQTGIVIRNRWKKLAEKYGLEIEIWGIPALTGFSICSKKAPIYKSLITQEMLAKGYLAGNCIYVSTEHTPTILEPYFNELDSVFSLIAKCEDGFDPKQLLKGPVCHNGFKRLN